MYKETLSDKQAISIVFLATLGSSVVLGVAVSAKENAWISISIALLFSVLMCLGYGRVFSNFHGKNLFEICETVFGKIIGKIFVAIYTWYALFIAAFVVRDMGDFMEIIGIREVPIVFTMLILIIFCIWMSKKSIISFGGWCTFFVPIVVFILLITYIFSLNNMQLDNILPVMYDGINPVIDGMLSTISFPFTEIIVFIMIFNNTLQKKQSIYKVLIWGVLLAGMLLFLLTVANIMILGPATNETSYFPAYESASRIQLGDFFEKIEITISLSLVTSVFVKSTCFIIAAAKGMACLFNLKEYTSLTTPIGFLIVILSYIYYENILESIETAKFDTYNGIFFQVVLFLIIFIASEIKIKKMKSIKKNR